MFTANKIKTYIIETFRQKLSNGTEHNVNWEEFFQEKIYKVGIMMPQSLSIDKVASGKSIVLPLVAVVDGHTVTYANYQYDQPIISIEGATKVSEKELSLDTRSAKDKLRDIQYYGRPRYPTAGKVYVYKNPKWIILRRIYFSDSDFYKGLTKVVSNKVNLEESAKIVTEAVVASGYQKENGAIVIVFK